MAVFNYNTICVVNFWFLNFIVCCSNFLCCNSTADGVTIFLSAIIVFFFKEFVQCFLNFCRRTTVSFTVNNYFYGFNFSCFIRTVNVYNYFCWNAYPCIFANFSNSVETFGIFVVQLSPTRHVEHVSLCYSVSFVCIPAFAWNQIVIFLNSFCSSEIAVSQFNVADSCNFVFTFCVVSCVSKLIISVQRHPDNIAWFEVYCFVIVEFCSGFFNQFAVFVCYKQGTIKLEFFWPISLFIGACAVGNSKSVSAHAKYHSRSHSYGKYFFHSLSSS